MAARHDLSDSDRLGSEALLREMVTDVAVIDIIIDVSKVDLMEDITGIRLQLTGK